MNARLRKILSLVLAVSMLLSMAAYAAEPTEEPSEEPTRQENTVPEVIPDVEPPVEPSVPTEDSETLPEEPAPTEPGEESVPMEEAADKLMLPEEDLSSIEESQEVAPENGGISLFSVSRTPIDVTGIESRHNYYDNTNQSWTVSCPGAERIELTFDSRTEFEYSSSSWFDYLTITDASGNRVGRYKGTQLAGQTITVIGNKAILRLTSDGLGTYWGFKVTEAYGLMGTGAFHATVIPPEHGSLTVFPMVYDAGETITVTAIPRGSHTLGTIYVDGEAITGNTFVATGNHTISAEFVEKRPGVAIAHSGICGYNLHWYLYEDGRLLITGSGAMYNYQYNGYASSTSPWNSYRSSIKSVIFENGVTSIGGHAFEYCSNLTSVVIPEGVTSIGDYAFHGCSSLTTVVIPEGITNIGWAAFRDCNQIQKVFYTGTPEQWRQISINDDNGCLTGAWRAYGAVFSLTIDKSIPNGRISIDGQNLFHAGDRVRFNVHPVPGCRLKSIYIDNKPIEEISFTVSGNHNISAEFELIRPGEYILDSGTCGKNLTWCLYYDGELHISGYGAMDDFKLDAVPWKDYATDYVSSIVIDNTVDTIGNYAFANCSKIRSVELPNGLTKLGDHVFDGCTALEAVTIPGSMTDFGAELFSNCPKFNQATLEEGINTIPGSLFANCGVLAEVNLPSSLTDIQNRAFMNCSALETIHLPDGLKNIGQYAFFYCTSLNNIQLPESVSNIDTAAFYGCTVLDRIHLPEALTTMGDAVFSDCTSLKSILLPGKLTKISNKTFEGCTGLVEVGFSSEVKTVKDSAFNGCSALERVLYAGNPRTWKEIAIEANNDPLLQAELIYRPMGMDLFTVTTAGEAVGGSYTLNGTMFRAIDTVTVTAIPEPGYVVKEICVDGKAIEGNTFKPTANHVVSVVFEREAGIADSGVCGADLHWVINDQGELHIIGTGAMDAFERGMAPWASHWAEIASVVIDPGVTSIGGAAFADCTALHTVSVPDSVTTIGNEAFTGCTELPFIEFPGNAPTLNGETVFPSKTPGEFAIYYHSGKEGWTTPSWNGYPSVCVEGASGEYSILDDQNRNVQGILFVINEEFGTATVGTNTLDHSNAGYTGSNSGHVVIPAAVTKQGNPDKRYPVIGIGQHAFSYNRFIKQVTIEADITSLDHTAFVGCNALQSFVCAEGVKGFSAVDGVLYNADQTILYVYPADKAWETFAIPETVATVSRYAFSDASHLKAITIPASVTGIQAEAFTGCSQLNAFHVAEGNTAYCTDKWDVLYTKNLDTLVHYPAARIWPYYNVNDKTGTVLPGAFSACGSLKNLYVPRTVETMAGSVSNCPGMMLCVYRGTAADVYAVREGLNLWYMDESKPDQVSVYRMPNTAVLPMGSEKLEGMYIVQDHVKESGERITLQADTCTVTFETDKPGLQKADIACGDKHTSIDIIRYDPNDSVLLTVDHISAGLDETVYIATYDGSDKMLSIQKAVIGNHCIQTVVSKQQYQDMSYAKTFRLNNRNAPAGESRMIEK